MGSAAVHVQPFTSVSPYGHHRSTSKGMGVDTWGLSSTYIHIYYFHSSYIAQTFQDSGLCIFILCLLRAGLI